MKKIFTRTAILWVALALFVSSCAPVPEGGTITQIESFYTSAKINGTEVNFTENKDGYVNGSGKGGAVVPAFGKYFERQATTFAKNGENKFSIYFLKLTANTPPSKDEIKSIFYQGNYAFGNSAAGFIKEGVEIRYVDDNGVEWNSQGDQSTSYFEVTEHNKNENDSYTPYVTSGKFNCKLYNYKGESIDVVDAKFKGRTVVYY